jgi:hypothetical protein
MARRLETVTVTWAFDVSETTTNNVWIHLMTQDGVPVCGYPGYTQARIQGGAPILKIEVPTAGGSFSWSIPNHAYEQTSCV